MRIIPIKSIKEILSVKVIPFFKSFNNLIKK